MRPLPRLVRYYTTNPLPRLRSAFELPLSFCRLQPPGSTSTFARYPSPLHCSTRKTLSSALIRSRVFRFYFHNVTLLDLCCKLQMSFSLEHSFIFRLGPTLRLRGITGITSAIMPALAGATFPLKSSATAISSYPGSPHLTFPLLISSFLALPLPIHKLGLIFTWQ